MRGILVLLAAAAVAGCANDMTAPTVQPQPSNSLSAMTDSAGRWRFGRRGAMDLFLARRLPPNLRLSDAQRNEMRTMVGAFRAAHQADLAAMRASMRAMMQQARAARASGQTLSVDQRRALLQQAAPARQRLMAAQRELAAQIQNILTADQKSWLASHRPAPCAGEQACRARFTRRGLSATGQIRNPS